ncbi:type II secretion system secretin GspD [Teredinibacter franksiae]|uniref:type II secretion system secretin GspD n=1 Tax=Teredinibacter franksiae TaxID=2761453 RepID=UPI0028A682C3|nr:type II secretion system secretin GspD [Teredinibacter franksiae]
MLKHFRIALCVVILGFSVVGSFHAYGAQERTYTVNFKDSDIHEVIKFVAEVTGKTLVIDPRVKGRVKVISQKPLTERELMELFRSVLEVHDFTIIEVGNIVRVVPLKDARSSPLPVKDNPEFDEGYVTQVIQLKNIAAAKVLPVLRPLVPQHSHLAAYDPSNAIVVSDTAANIERIKEIIEKIDTAALPTTEIIELKYADSENLVATLTKLDRAAGSKGAAPANRLQMVADKRNNAILISGEDLQRQRVKKLIYRLDRPQMQTGNVRVVYLEYATAKDVATVLSKVVQNMQRMAPGGDKKTTSGQGATVEADEATNALLITANPEILEALLAVVERLDIRRAQVLVEAIIVEMALGEKESLGVEWMFQNASQGLLGASTGAGSAAGIAAALFGSAEEATVGLAGALGSMPGETFGVAGNTGDQDFIVLVNMLKNNTNANILSTPTLLTMDNNEAMISVGQNVPFVTGSFTNSGGNGGSNPFQTIQREDVGITLTVTPHVNEGDKVIMEIQQEISSVDNAAAISASDVITNQRKVETQVMAKDGEVIVLGGLIRDDIQMGERRVPLLGSIPILGRAFRSNSTNIVKSNLMIFIRPTIVRDDETLEGATAEKYRYIRDLQVQQRSQSLQDIPEDMLRMLPEWEEQIKGYKNTEAEAK